MNLKEDLAARFVACHLIGKKLVVSTMGRRAEISPGHKDYDQVMKLYKDGLRDDLCALLFPEERIKEFSSLDMQVENGKIYYKGEEVERRLATHMLSLMNQGLPYVSWVNFWRRLHKNPEQSSRDQLYNFIEKNGIAITDEGLLMVYKSVRSDMTDHHTGRVQYKMHAYTRMDRSKVECSPSTGCGRGLHVGSYKYAAGFGSGGILLEILVDPEHVVSVPHDCNFQKIRCCELYVANKCETECKSPIYNAPEPAKQNLKDAQPAPLNEKECSDVHEVKIGRWYYKRSTIKSPDLEKNLTDPNPYMPLNPSDFPKFFQDLKVNEVFRQRNGSYSNYVAKSGSVIVQYVKVDKTQEPKPAKKSKKKTSKADKGIRIGRYFYDKNQLAEDKAREYTNGKNPYVSLTPSDWPLFFKKLDTALVYRQRNGASSNYLVLMYGKWFNYTHKK